MKNLLPNGSIVLLKGGNTRVMIIGRIQRQVDTDKIWDYASCLYPQGFISADKLYLFNHDQIEKIYFIGFQDEEELAFKEYLESEDFLK